MQQMAPTVDSVENPLAHLPGQSTGHGPDAEDVFAALEDTDCRDLLAATSDEPLSAQELVQACDIPRSTTYRKVERLADVGLLETSIRIRTDGKHTTEYRCAFEDLTVSLSDGFEVGVSAAPMVAGD